MGRPPHRQQSSRLGVTELDLGRLRRAVHPYDSANDDLLSQRSDSTARRQALQRVEDLRCRHLVDDVGSCLDDWEFHQATGMLSAQIATHDMREAAIRLIAVAVRRHESPHDTRAGHRS